MEGTSYYDHVTQHCRYNGMSLRMLQHAFACGKGLTEHDPIDADIMIKL